MALVLGAVLGVTGCSSSGSTTSSVPRGPVGTPTGTVTVRSDGKVVCVITLDKNGTGTCQVSTKGDGPGKITYTGTYQGTSKFDSGTGSTTVTLLPPAGPVASPTAPTST